MSATSGFPQTENTAPFVFTIWQAMMNSVVPLRAGTSQSGSQEWNLRARGANRSILEGNVRQCRRKCHPPLAAGLSRGARPVY